VSGRHVRTSFCGDSQLFPSFSEVPFCSIDGRASGSQRARTSCSNCLMLLASALPIIMWSLGRSAPHFWAAWHLSFLSCNICILHPARRRTAWWRGSWMAVLQAHTSFMSIRHCLSWQWACSAQLSAATWRLFSLLSCCLLPNLRPGTKAVSEAEARHSPGHNRGSQGCVTFWRLFQAVRRRLLCAGLLCIIIEISSHKLHTTFAARSKSWSCSLCIVVLRSIQWVTLSMVSDFYLHTPAAQNSFQSNFDMWRSTLQP
jgi:hypothetical protein